MDAGVQALADGAAGGGGGCTREQRQRQPWSDVQRMQRPFACCRACLGLGLQHTSGPTCQLIQHLLAGPGEHLARHLLPGGRRVSHDLCRQLAARWQALPGRLGLMSALPAGKAYTCLDLLEAGVSVGAAHKLAGVKHAPAAPLDALRGGARGGACGRQAPPLEARSSVSAAGDLHASHSTDLQVHSPLLGHDLERDLRHTSLFQQIGGGMLCNAVAVVWSQPRSPAPP